MSWKHIGNHVQVTRTTEGDGLGRFRWNNGMKVGRNASAGMWYAKSEAFVGSLPTGWARSLAFEGDGYEAKQIKMLPILKRSQPFTKSGDSVVWHAEWQANAGMKMYTEVLCLLEGYDEPLVMTGKGWAASRITHYKRGVFGEQTEYITKPASAQADKPLQPWAFWHTIGGAYSKGGEPVFVEVGSGTQKTHLHDIVLVGVNGPADDALLDALYVGDELYEKATKIYTVYTVAEWHKEKRKSTSAPVSTEPTESDEDLAF